MTTWPEWIQDIERERAMNRLHNIKCRDSVDALLAAAGYSEDSSARHGLAMMNFDVMVPGIFLASGQEPVGVLHVGSQYDGELNDWEFEANQSMCDALNEAYAAKGKEASISIYTHPAPAQQPLSDEQKQLIYDETGAGHALISLVEMHIKEKP